MIVGKQHINVYIVGAYVCLEEEAAREHTTLIRSTSMLSRWVESQGSKE